MGILLAVIALDRGIRPCAAPIERDADIQSLGRVMPKNRRIVHFTDYLDPLGQSQTSWRMMLPRESIPAALFLQVGRHLECLRD